MSALVRLTSLAPAITRPAIRCLAAETAAKSKRGQSGYNVYFSEQMKKIRAEDKTTKPSEITKIIGRNWSNLSEAEKAAYKPK